MDTIKTLQHNGSNLRKHELLAQWAALEPNQDPLASMRCIAGGGSSYGGDGIRICGSDAFVSAVLSRLQDMLDGENQLTLLKASHSIVKPTEINGTKKEWLYSGGNCVYIQLQECRSGIGDREKTERYMDRVPGLRESVRKGKVAWLMFLGYSREDAEEIASKR